MVVAFALLAAVPAISPQRFGIGYDGLVALAKNSAHGEVIVATDAEVITVDEDGAAVSNSLPVPIPYGAWSAVAISDDGTFVAVRAGGGAVDVYKLDSEGYGVATSLSGGSNAFGASISLSGNGSVLVVGAPSDFPFADVYEWNGSAYNARSTHSGAAYSSFGASVSVSADGSRFVVGAPEFDDNNEGRGVVFEYNASTGMTVQLGDPLSVSGSTRLGYRMRMSSDGNAVLATWRNYTYRFAWNGDAWSVPTTVFALPDSDEDMSVGFVNIVALSGDGLIAARADVMGIFSFGLGSEPLIETTRLKIRIRDVSANAVETRGEWDIPDSAVLEEFEGGIDLNYDGTVMVIAAYDEIRAYYRDDAGSWDLTDPTAPTTAAPTAAPTTAAGAESNAESDGLSDASIAGIVAASVVVGAALGAVAYRFYMKRRSVFGEL